MADGHRMTQDPRDARVAAILRSMISTGARQYSGTKRESPDQRRARRKRDAANRRVDVDVDRTANRLAENMSNPAVIAALGMTEALPTKTRLVIAKARAVRQLETKRPRVPDAP